MSNVPATARLPSSVALKRTPSSSAKPTTSTANGSLRPLACKLATHSMPADHTEHAIVFARIAHRVEMRAQHQARRTRPITFVAANDVADRVETRAHARLAHPCKDELIGRTLLGREVYARECVGLLRTSGQRFAALEDARAGGECCGGHRRRNDNGIRADR